MSLAFPFPWKEQNPKPLLSKTADVMILSIYA